MRLALKIIGGVLLFAILANFVLPFLGSMPDNLGITNGQLQACPGTPNCVSTQSMEADFKMEPIAYTGEAADKLEKLVKVINDYPRTNIITQDDNYIHAEFRTAVFNYVDDVEFYFDDTAKQLHFRSASRVGKSDLGVNRKRMEELKALIEQ